jgi:hypothetical protein
MAQIGEVERKFRYFIDNQAPKEFTQKDFYDHLIRAIESMEKSGKVENERKGDKWDKKMDFKPDFFSLIHPI